MDCSCIRGTYNFYAEAIDKNTLVYQDLSNWMDETNYEFPDNYEVTITLPRQSIGSTYTLSVGSTNRLGTEEFAGPLEDGVYCFEVSSCGKNYKKSVGLFPHIECCIKQAWATLGLEFEDKILEVEKHLNLAKINVELNNVITADSNLTIAKKLLENLKCAK